MQPYQDKLSRLMSEFSRAFNALERKFRAELPVTLPQSRIIEAIAKYHRISVKGLSEYLGVSISTMSRNVDKLASIGLIQKKPETEDARMSAIVLNAQGKTLAKHIERVRNKYFAEIFSYLPPEKIPEYIEAGKKLLSATEKTYLRKSI